MIRVSSAVALSRHQRCGSGELYLSADDDGRRLLNQALSEKLLVEDEVVIEAVMRDDLAVVVEAEKRRAVGDGAESDEPNERSAALRPRRLPKPLL